MARILIIDDDESVRTASKKILEANGFDVVAVADGASGVNAIRDQQFDLVIVDLFMPGMNGLDTTKAIRKLNRLVPIIAASGFMFGRSCPDMPNFEAMVMEAGATSALYKPFRPKELVQAIEKAIGVTNSEAPLAAV
jgi:CheY-like chemotaxis protein